MSTSAASQSSSSRASGPSSTAPPTPTTPTVDRRNFQRNLPILERQIRELRSTLSKQRIARRTATDRARQKRYAALAASSSSSSSSTANSSSATDDHLFSSWITGDAGRTADGQDAIRKQIETRLAQLDDETLTRLLTLSTSALVRLVVAGPHPPHAHTTSALLSIPTLLVPSKSVGIEGIGSGRDIDALLASTGAASSALVDPHGRLGPGDQARRALAGEAGAGAAQDTPVADTPGTSLVKDAREKAGQARWMRDWLQQRRYRGDRLLSHLVHFTHLTLQQVTQTPLPAHRATSHPRRSLQVTACLSDLCALTLCYDIHDTPPTPQIEALRLVSFPAALRAALSARAHLDRTLRHANLPALLLSLRTLLTLSRARQALFAALAERYRTLVSDQSTLRHDAVWVPPARDALPPGRDPPALQPDTVLSRLVDPQHAERLVLRNDRQATLTLTFAIHFTRHGHAHPAVSLHPSLPPSIPAPALLDTFNARFHHLVHVVTSRSASRSTPQTSDPSSASTVEAGLFAAIVTVVDAFFGIE